MINQKKLVIIKISGASLKGDNDIISIDFLNQLAKQLKEISLSYKVAVVLGGGNIWRGNIASKINMERYKADQMGMLATVMNSLALQSALNNQGCKANVFSTIEMEKIADNYVIRNLKKSLDNDEIAILSCGTGRPYFSTDTGIAVSAAELGATYILMGKNNVDGVYDKDPNKYLDAKFFEHLTYTKAINDELKVMDASAASICMQTNIKIIVFKINEENGITNALNFKTRFTLISNDPSDLDDINLIKSSNEDSILNETIIEVNQNIEERSDEEIEQLLTEEIPVYGHMSDNDIEAIESFLNEVKEIDNKEKENKKDFATEFFEWNNKPNNDSSLLNSNDFIKEEEIQIDTNPSDILEKTFEDFLESKKVENEIIEDLNNDQEYIIESDIIFEENEINENNEVVESEQKIENNDSVENEEVSNFDISKLLDQKNRLTKNSEKFWKKLDYYIEEIKKIKNEIIEENKNKTNEIKEFIERKL